MKKLLVSLILIATPAAYAGSRNVDLDSWVERDLIPYVEQQLSTMPRFRDETFRFVVMQEDSPQSEGSALSIALRDRVRDANANYLIGIEVRERSPGEVNVSVRALDVEERSWVAGFTRHWQGSLSGSQRRMLRTISSDPTFRGERDAPWKDSETDLMAAHLAYELGCKLLGQTAGEYVIAGKNFNGDVDLTTALVELVSNNLAGVRALRFTAGDANAVIDGKAHRIDDDLFQYWVTITPADSESPMTALSADAYVQIPDPYKAATLVPEVTFEIPGRSNGFISSFGVVRMTSSQSCASDSHWYSGASNSRNRGGDCFALQLEARDDAVVFFLNHQLNYGLVRLADRNCARRSMARVARLNEALRLPLPLDTLQSGAWSNVDSWSLSPRADTYYAIATTDTAAARALSKHIEQLPQRCGASVRPGIEKEELRRWLEELTAMSEHWSPSIEWRSLRVKDVY